jgi:hypothetical protein
MTRRASAIIDQSPAEPTARLHVHRIHANAVYSVTQAQAALNLRTSTIRRELREGRLRISKRAGRYYILGEWLIEWLRGGELPPRCGTGHER